MNWYINRFLASVAVFYPVKTAENRSYGFTRYSGKRKLKHRLKSGYVSGLSHSNTNKGLFFKLFFKFVHPCPQLK